MQVVSTTVIRVCVKTVTTSGTNRIEATSRPEDVRLTVALDRRVYTVFAAG